MVAEKHNQVTFKVLQDATKPEVKAAVETDVQGRGRGASRCVNIKGKTKRFGRSHRPPRQRASKAYVALKPGQELNLAGRPRNMAVVKVETDLARPTRRGQGRRRDTCTRARPHAALLEAQKPNGRAATTTATSPPATRAVATSTTTAWSTSIATRTASRPRSSASSTTRTARRTSRWCCYADGERRYIIAPARPGSRRDRRESGSEAPIKRRQHAADPQHPGRLDHPLRRAAARQGRAARALGRHLGPACWRVKAATRSCACAPARFARCTSTAAPRSARSATKSTACARSARPARCAGRGIRPTVRGVAMNPVDHPHGGGEGRTGDRPSPGHRRGATLTKGYRTRSNKRTQTS